MIAAFAQLLVITGLSLLLWFALLWTAFRLTSPGSEKALTDPFRRRKA